MNMNKTIAMLAMLLLLVGFSACSNDTEDDNSWRENLQPVYGIVAKGNWCGIGQAADLTYYIRIVDRNGNDMLFDRRGGNVCESDWYFEMDGKKYCKGDTMPVKGNQKPVEIKYYVGPGFYCISPTWVDWQILKEDPVHHSYYFVWPSKNIRKKLDLYAEYNSNYEAEKEALENTLKEGEIEKLVIYKRGNWVDGNPDDTEMAIEGIHTIRLDIP